MTFNIEIVVGFPLGVCEFDSHRFSDLHHVACFSSCGLNLSSSKKVLVEISIKMGPQTHMNKYSGFSYYNDLGSIRRCVMKGRDMSLQVNFAVSLCLVVVVSRSKLQLWYHDCQCVSMITAWRAMDSLSESIKLP